MAPLPLRKGRSNIIIRVTDVQPRNNSFFSSVSPSQGQVMQSFNFGKCCTTEHQTNMSDSRGDHNKWQQNARYTTDQDNH